MRRIFSLYLGLLLMAVVTLAQRERIFEIKHNEWGTIKLKLREGEKLIDWHGAQVLIVDRDDTVKKYFFSKSGELDRDLSRFISVLGQAVYISGSLNLSEYIPDNEVAVHARRVTDQQVGFTNHVIVTWGANKDRGPKAWPPFQYTTYVFLQKGSDVRKVYEERSGNSELRGFWVRDINNDGLVEIIDRGYEMNTVKLVIRQIQANGTVKWIQEIDGRKINFDVDSGTIYVEGYDTLDDGTVVDAKKWYGWNTQKNQFEVTAKDIQLDKNGKMIEKQLQWDPKAERWKEYDEEKESRESNLKLKARVIAMSIAKATQIYHLINNKFPSSSEELTDVLRVSLKSQLGNELKKSKKSNQRQPCVFDGSSVDPWNNSLKIIPLDESKFLVISFGSNSRLDAKDSELLDLKNKPANSFYPLSDGLVLVASLKEKIGCDEIMRAALPDLMRK